MGVRLCVRVCMVWVGVYGMAWSGMHKIHCHYLTMHGTHGDTMTIHCYFVTALDTTYRVVILECRSWL